jgi:uncharacterized tellurite resistance protein B-like protein
MLKKFLALFEESAEADEPEHTLELATAALLSEVLRADNVVKQEELHSLKQQLSEHFHLTDEELHALLDDGQNRAEHAVDLVQFTKVINEALDNQQRVGVLESMWQVAISDGHLDMYEEHIIRKISDLMYIPHSQYIQAKLRVTQPI